MDLKNNISPFEVVIILSLIAVVICVILHLKLDNSSDYDSLLGVVGSVASIIGIIVTIMQVQDSISASRAAETAAKTAVDNISKFKRATDMSAMLSMVDHIETLLTSKEYIAARISISDVKVALIKMKTDGDNLLPKESKTNIQSTIRDLGIDIVTLAKASNETTISASLSIEEIVKHLESAKNEFATYEEKLVKFQVQ